MFGQILTLLKGNPYKRMTLEKLEEEKKSFEKRIKDFEETLEVSEKDHKDKCRESTELKSQKEKLEEELKNSNLEKEEKIRTEIGSINYKIEGLKISLKLTSENISRFQREIRSRKLEIEEIDKQIKLRNN